MPVTQTHEVEVKVLLQTQDRANAFVRRLKDRDPSFSVLRKTSQLNHYFDEQGDPKKLLANVEYLLTRKDRADLASILNDYQSFALRTRWEDGTVSLVVKAAQGGGDDQHAVSRREGEYQVKTDYLGELDRCLREAGYGYLSKWSRDRREYRYKDYTVCVDKNAGYGFLAEIEQVVDSAREADPAKRRILDEVADLEFEELSQDRLGRMFAYYNDHWPQYYKTDKTFIVE